MDDGLDYSLWND